MARRSTNKADLEYALMMTILNFHTEFMRSNYANVQVQVSQDQIEVTLTRQGAVPAEMNDPEFSYRVHAIELCQCSGSGLSGSDRGDADETGGGPG